MALEEDEEEETPSGVWATDEAGDVREDEGDHEWEDTQILFEDSLESLLQEPGDETVYRLRQLPEGEAETVRRCEKIS